MRAGNRADNAAAAAAPTTTYPPAGREASRSYPAAGVGGLPMMVAAP